MQKEEPVKRALIACAILSVIPAAADAQTSRLSVGLYADGSRSSQFVMCGWQPFEVWVWWRPGTFGFISARYRISFPANVVTIEAHAGPDMLSRIDDGVIFLAFNYCRMDWAWTHYFSCTLGGELQGLVAVCPPAGESEIRAVTCGYGDPMEPVVILNEFGINQDAVIAVEPQTWGAIKGLYR